MQLLAGVKLCTGRPITNHPHYEDKALRRRTKEVNASLSFCSYFSNVFHAGLANPMPLCGLSIAFNFRRFSGFIKLHSFFSIVTYHSCYMELLSLTSVDFCCLHIWSAVNFVTVVDVELRWSVMQSVATCIIKSYSSPNSQTSTGLCSELTHTRFIQVHGEIVCVVTAIICRILITVTGMSNPYIWKF